MHSYWWYIFFMHLGSTVYAYIVLAILVYDLLKKFVVHLKKLTIAFVQHCHFKSFEFLEYYHFYFTKTWWEKYYMSNTECPWKDILMANLVAMTNLSVMLLYSIFIEKTVVFVLPCTVFFYSGSEGLIQNSILVSILTIYFLGPTWKCIKKPLIQNKNHACFVLGLFIYDFLNKSVVRIIFKTLKHCHFTN